MATTAKQSIAPELVMQFVKVGHGDLDATKKLLKQESGLLNACWDWGGGDWETALGGASHMGRKDIAEFLLESGARMDIFAAALFDKVEIVQGIIEANPAAAKAKGPHGFTLELHAKKGDAKRVLKYLKTL